MYTSYDYGSAIKENRELTPKYDELKLQGLFLRSSPEFWKTDVVGNSSAASGAVRVSRADKDAEMESETEVLVVKLKNPDTSAGFWIARQRNSSST